MRVIQKYRVPSKSKKGEYHLVQEFEDGVLVCDCKAFSFKGSCSHIKIIKHYQLKKYEKNS